MVGSASGKQIYVEATLGSRPIALRLPDDASLSITQPSGPGRRGWFENPPIRRSLKRPKS
jgi:hypothetical protein